MKTDELRKLSLKELADKLKFFENELLKLRFQMKLGQAANPLKKREFRKNIAKVMTILKEALSAK